jgi:hypothetical protein
MEGRNLEFKLALAMGWTKHIRTDTLAAYPAKSLTTFEDSAYEEYHHHWVPPQFDGDTNFNRKVPNYSTDIKDAFEIIIYLKGLKYDYSLHSNPYLSNGLGGHVAEFIHPLHQVVANESALLPAYAICKAAMVVFEKEKENAS